MPANPETILSFLKEMAGLIRDWRDPAKREANYRLHLEKNVRKKLEVAKDYKHTVQQYRWKVKALLSMYDNKHPDEISKEEERSLRLIERYLTKYEKKF